MSDPMDHLERIQKALGVKFAGPELLTQALTHTSYRNEHAGIERDNERLEFLGDAVIELAVSDYLWEAFPEASEGALTRHRSFLVRREALAGIARELDLGAGLRLGRGDEKCGGREKASVLADAFEAVIAAIHLEQGFSAASAVVHRCIAGRAAQLMLENPASYRIDYKTRLQERVQAVQRKGPTYVVERETGPDHEKWFDVAVTIRSGASAQGRGRSKKEAEQTAASALLQAFDADPSLIPEEE